MSFNGKFHPKGSPQSPQNSEYEVIDSLNIYRVLAAQNAEFYEGKYLKVIDEDKPVFFIALPFNGQCIWTADNNRDLGKKEKFAKMSFQKVLSGDAGAMLSFRTGNESLSSRLLIIVRTGAELYYCGDESLLTDNDKHIKHSISFDDLLEFIAGEISWSDLRGRSITIEKKRQREISAQEKNRRLQTELVRVSNLLSEAEKDYHIKNGELIVALQEVVEAREEIVDAKAEMVSILEKLPSFIQWMFLRDKEEFAKDNVCVV